MTIPVACSIVLLLFDRSYVSGTPSPTAPAGSKGHGGDWRQLRGRQLRHVRQGRHGRGAAELTRQRRHPISAVPTARPVCGSNFRRHRHEHTLHIAKQMTKGGTVLVSDAYPVTILGLQSWCTARPRTAQLAWTLTHSPSARRCLPGLVLLHAGCPCTTPYVPHTTRTTTRRPTAVHVHALHC